MASASSPLRSSEPLGILSPDPETAAAETECEPARIAELLRIVGPSKSLLLLTELHGDLERIRCALEPAIHNLAWSDLCRLTHNLAALAGTVSAAHLLDAARDMHDICKAERVPDVSALAPEVLRRTARLVAQIDSRRKAVRAAQGPDA